MNTISIDFGTTNTQVAYLSANGEPRILRVGGTENIPSVLYFKSNENELLVGEIALRTYEKDLTAARRAFKDHKISESEYEIRVSEIHQCLRQQFKTDLFAQRNLKYCYTPTPERDITWVEALAAIFVFCKENAEKGAFAGEPVKAVRFTHPACFSDELKALYEQAARAAGFTEISFIAEPVAAFMAYERMKPANMQQHDNVLVFDMGGGTLDIVTVSRKNDGSFDLRGESRLTNQNGDNAGGACIDHALYDEFISEIRSDLHNENFNSDARFITYVRKQVKERLGEGIESDCSISYTFLGDVNYTFESEYRYEDLEDLVNAEMRPVYNDIQQYIENAQVKPTLILMVGGSSKLKPIQDKLKSLFSDGENCVKVFSPADADYLVARGALLLSRARCDFDVEAERGDADMLSRLFADAWQGHAEAQFNLGVRHARGEGVVIDKKKAVAWYRKVAGKGHAEAQYNLGVCYAKGEGVEMDEEKAVAWYRKAAGKGHAEAQYNLGVRCDFGNGVVMDKKKAVTWYRMAAGQGHAEAQCNLGVCYAGGEGVAEDKKKAVTWYRKAAMQGHAEAQFNLGLCYDDRCNGVEMDKKKAVAWYRKAAEQGLAEAQCNLGACYARGEGVEMDKKKAVAWYRKAAGQGLAEAQYNLGVCYANGEGVEMDKKKAVAWYRKAAGQGLADAQYKLAQCYELGIGVEMDKEKAKTWKRKAAGQKINLLLSFVVNALSYIRLPRIKVNRWLKSPFHFDKM